jgi:hypothetical protein
VVGCCAGVEAWDGDRVSGYEARYAVYACRVLGCSATGTLSENLSSYMWRLLVKVHEKRGGDVPGFYGPKDVRVGRTHRRKLGRSLREDPRKGAWRHLDPRQMRRDFRARYEVGHDGMARWSVPALSPQQPSASMGLMRNRAERVDFQVR